MKLKTKNKVKALIGLIAALVIGVIGGFTIDFTIRPTEINEEYKVEAEFAIELSDEQVPAVIETEDGEEIIQNVPTVEEIDNGMAENEEELDFGQGAYFPTENPWVFRDATLHKCIDLDGKYGSQCVDLANAFWSNYAGRWFSTCGTGAAKGAWNCKEHNAGGEFELIYDTHSLQAGDWIIFSGGTYGHVGMALGGYNNGYVALLGTNQGGAACRGGGSATNIINMSLRGFVGAFRPKSYIHVDPTPTPAPEGTVQYTYVKGDNFGSVVLRLGLGTSYGLWGPNGDVAFYNQQLLAQGIVVLADGRIVGNIPIGTTITLERR